MSRGKALVLALVAVFVVIPVIGFIALYIAYFAPLGDSKPFKQAAFNRVVAEIQRGDLKPDRQGVVLLPRDRALLSATGRVYVRRCPSGRLVAFIPSWVGRSHLLNFLLDDGDEWLEAYIYDSRPESRKHPEHADDYPDDLGPPPGRDRAHAAAVSSVTPCPGAPPVGVIQHPRLS